MRMRMTSTARSAMRLASSWIVIVSGIVTSRTIFSFGSLSRWPVMRWTRRRNEATERSRTSSADSAVTTVSRPRRFSPARGAWGFFFVGFERRTRAGLGRHGVGAEALLGDLVGLALGLLVVLAANF